MKNFFFIILCCIQLTVFSQEHYWQQQVNYTIDVKLNDAEHSLEGFEKIEYINNSPDTLDFIWFHLWPNAFKNDKTAFSRQLLANGRTDFYFSDKEERGYINRIDFKVNGITAKTEDHPEHIDIIKLVLPAPLPPGKSVNLNTSFHVKLPHNFSRGGHIKQAYQVTQWYPKPAVYDRKGWHPMPYLDQGEFYSEFGNYDVRITVPADYVVAATGKLQNKEELLWLQSKAGHDSGSRPLLPSTVISMDGKANPGDTAGVAATSLKTLRFIQNNVHDFAWFADKRFIVNYDTLKLSSGRVVDVFSFYLPPGKYWKNSIGHLKDALTSRSGWLGEYPYQVVSAVEAGLGFTGGMEYPTIANYSGIPSEKALDNTIAHEVGHNWFYGILATNERLYPWMDEGINSYYDKRYKEMKYPASSDRAGTLNGKATFLTKRWPVSIENMILETFAGIKKDQPVNTPSPRFTKVNYGLIAYYKAGEWVSKLESELGKEMFDSCMHEYYRRWQFQHPYPEDFKATIASVSGRNLDSLFDELNQSGSLLPEEKKKIQFATLFNLHETTKYHYISLAPFAGVNMYDGIMVGALLHNYQLPVNKLNFFVTPLFAVRSKKLNGLARMSYSWYPDQTIYKIDLGINAARFTINEFQPAEKEKLYSSVLKVAAFARVTFNEKNALSNTRRYIQFKSFLFRENQLEFRQTVSGTDTSEVAGLVAKTRVLNQLKFVIENTRILYPYRGEFNIEQQKGFLRLMFTGDYYFNYANGTNGLKARLFAGKFLYTGAQNASRQFETGRYHLNLTSPDGYEDYTYSNYFIGRNKFEKWGSQQVMIRDGGFKVNTDLLSNEVGKTDDWLLAANFSTGVPEKINPLKVLPVKIPLKIFADIGTYPEAWDRDADLSRFLFDAGFQLSMFKETVNIYFPVIYSTIFKDYFKSTLGKQRFLKTITFSIDVQNFTLKKLNRDIPL